MNPFSWLSAFNKTLDTPSEIMTKFLDDFGGGIIGILTRSAITTSGGILAMFVWSNLGEKIKSRTDEPAFVKKAFTILGSLLFILAILISIRGF